MTLAEATQKGIKLLTRPEWAKSSRMHIDIIKGKEGAVFYGPWGTVYDGAVDAGMLKPQKLCLIMPLPSGFDCTTDDQWEEYTGEHKV